MVRASEIKDEASLRAWLEVQSPGHAATVAVRAALRVAPQYWAGDASAQQVSAQSELLVSRALLVSTVAILRPGAKLRSFEVITSALGRADPDFPVAPGGAAALATARMATKAAQLAYAGDLSLGSASPDAGSIAGGTTAASRSAAAAAGVARYASLQPADAKGAAADAAAASARAAITDATIADAVESEAGRDPFKSELWHHKVPDWVPMVHRDWRARGGGWVFWADWYEGYLTGKPLNIDLLEKVAEIEPEDWDKGDDNVNGIIERIRRDYAIARTPNGEAIAVNPETGKLRIEVDTLLPGNLATYARRKIRAAVDVFALAHNQYTALAPDLHRLRQAADDPEFTPVELFDECASASRRLASRIRNGEVPEAEQDALIADYAHRLREAGADILANDPRTQEVLTARARITGTDALLEEAEAVRAGVDLLVPVTEGLLARRLPEDAAVATDPSADLEERKVAGVKLASRYLRSAAAQVSLAGRAVVGTAKTLEAISVIRSSPVFQAALQAVYRYLGF